MKTIKKGLQQQTTIYGEGCYPKTLRSQTFQHFFNIFSNVPQFANPAIAATHAPR